VTGRRAAFGALALAGTLVAVAPPAPGPRPIVQEARAEHQVSYRYVVLGYVTDAGNRGRPGVRVELRREKTGFSYLGETDTDGFYVIVARLGDESAGETLTLRIGPGTTTGTARFDATNHADDRGTRVDLDGATLVERTTAFRPTLTRFVRSERP